MGTLLSVARLWLQQLGPWRLAFGVLVAAALAGFGPRLAADRHPAFDEVVLERIHGAIPDGLGQLLLLVYQLSGVHVTAFLVLAVLAFLVWRRLWAELVCLAVGTAGILVIVDRWLKPLFDRSRPSNRLLEDISGRSFPSGHAAGSVVFYFLTCTLLAAHYPRLRRPLFLVSSAWVALVWLSTLYCRAHWLTDIVAGASLGYVWLSCCLAGFAVWERRQRPA
ncbi:phosphatase PAP2 family protein [Vulcanococcus limneticus]|uniref:phosphatase PAP2 family protein n=1 Tax=Vulcanococcus limneticus TaxID=2170428 RepID=UPI00398C14F5